MEYARSGKQLKAYQCVDCGFAFLVAGRGVPTKMICPSCKRKLMEMKSA